MAVCIDCVSVRMLSEYVRLWSWASADLPDGARRAAVGVREPVRDGRGVPERLPPLHRQLPVREPRCGRLPVYRLLLAVRRQQNHAPRLRPGPLHLQDECPGGRYVDVSK